MQPRLLRFTHLICTQHFNIFDLPYETKLFSGGHPEKQFRSTQLYLFIGLETNICFQNKNVGSRLKGCLSKSMLRFWEKFCFYSNLQRYTSLALWRVMNVCKDSLSLFSLWFHQSKRTIV